MMGDVIKNGKRSNAVMPFFDIQYDWEDALSKAGGVSWISVKNPGEDVSTQGELKHDGKKPSSDPTLGNVNVKPSAGPFIVVSEKSGGRFLTVNNKNTECTFVAAGSELNRIHKASIVCMDVSEGGLGVSISSKNELNVWESGSGVVRRELIGHPIDAYTCKFFPSGMVVVSGGADCCLKIWSVEDGQCPVTLLGHTGAIQDICIVERGRNIISVSKDGTAKLWDCGESKCLATLFSCGAIINACALMVTTSIDLGSPMPHKSDREILTDGKLLIVAREDSKVSGIGVASRKKIFTLDLPSAGNCCVQVGNNSIAVGCQGGQLVIFDITDWSQQYVIQSCTSSPILDLLVHPKSQVDHNYLIWVAKADGNCVLVNTKELTLAPDERRVMIALTGPNCDPVYKLRKDLSHIYTCCRDGVVRKYSLNIINKLLQVQNVTLLKH